MDVWSSCAWSTRNRGGTVPHHAIVAKVLGSADVATLSSNGLLLAVVIVGVMESSTFSEIRLDVGDHYGAPRTPPIGEPILRKAVVAKVDLTDIVETPISSETRVTFVVASVKESPTFNIVKVLGITSRAALNGHLPPLLPYKMLRLFFFLCHVWFLFFGKTFDSCSTLVLCTPYRHTMVETCFT